MRLLVLFVFVVALFGCDTSSNVKAYNDYNQAKERYIQAIIDNNSAHKIEALKEIVSCGQFLGFDVQVYLQRLQKLQKTTTYVHKKHNPLKIKSPYIKIVSYNNPIIVSYSNKIRLKFWTFHKYGKFYKVFDLYNAKVNFRQTKKLTDDIYMKIGQNNKQRVRIVFFSKTYFKIKYTTQNQKLIITLPNKTFKKPANIIQLIHKHKNTNKIIVIDPGHGGKDPGGIGYHHIREKNIVLPLAKFLKSDLQKQGYKVYLTRDSDRFITLQNRTKFANQKHADLFISIHCNIAPHHPEVYGIETYFLSPARSSKAKNIARLENSAIGNIRSSTTQNIVLNFLNKNRIIASDKLAIDIQKNLIYHLRKHYTHIKDGGVRPAPFWVLVGTNMPAILIETGYISNKLEAYRLSSKSYQKRYAKYIADGIDSYFRKNP